MVIEEAEGGTHTVDGHADERRVEAVFSRKSSKLERGFRTKVAGKTREVGYDCVRHALWDQDQCDCRGMSMGKSMWGRMRTGNAGDEITSQPSRVWGTGVRCRGRSVGERALLYRVIHPSIGNRLLM